MILHPTRQHLTNEFHWQHNTKTFSAEASSLRWPIAPLEQILGQAYDDACDLGFTLVSEKTGMEVTVAINCEKSDPDYSGGWKVLEFVPCDLKYRDAFKVVIFND